MWPWLTEPAAVPPPDCVIQNALFNGLAEMLAVDSSRFLMVERSVAAPCKPPPPPAPKWTIKIFLADFEDASNIKYQDSILEKPNLRMMRKELVLDLDELGIPLLMIEGITFGPKLPGGEWSVILVSDNNFSPFFSTQFLAFAIEDDGYDEDDDD